MNNRHFLTAIAVLVFFGVSLSHGTTFTLTDGNATLQANDASSAGAFNFSVNGNDQLAQLNYWYRIGTSGAEQSMNAISAPVSVATTNTLTTTYTAANSFSLSILWSVTGGTPGQASFSENVTVTNLSTSALDFHLFGYDDFDLGLDSVSFAGSTFTQTSSPLTMTTVYGTTPSEVEAHAFPTTFNRMNDGVATTLDNTTSSGPGDQTFAAQFDQTIAVGDTFGVRATHSLTTSAPAVPLPTSVWMGLVLLPLATFIGRRKPLRVL